MANDTYSYTVLGTFDLINGTPDIVQLSNGDLFVLQNDQNGDIAPSKGTIEFLAPTAGTITNVTSQMTSGTLPTDVNVVNINQLYVGNNLLPDIFLADQRVDTYPWLAGQLL